MSSPDDGKNEHSTDVDDSPQQDADVDAGTPAGSDVPGHDGKDASAAERGSGGISDQNKNSDSTSYRQPEGVTYDYNDDDPNAQHATAGQDSSKSAISPLLVGLIIAVGAAAFFAGAYVMNDGQQQDDLITQGELDDAIAKIELKILQGQLAEKQQAQQQQQPTPRPVNISADDDPTIGDIDAPITIIEFSDFQCPFCARFNAQTLPLIYEEYVDKGLAKLVYRDFPLQNHPNAVVTALAAECADDQGMFKGMHDTLFENQREWSGAGPQDISSILMKYASEIGINTDEFETCIATGAHIEDIRMDLEDGRAYGVTGTPAFYIGNDEIGYVSLTGAQPFESFKRVIDSQLGAS